MSRRVDLATLAVAVAVHAGVAVGITRGHDRRAPRASTVELDFRSTPVPPPAAGPAAPAAAGGPPARAPKPAAPRRRIALRERVAPAVPEARPAPAAPTPKPMFAVAMASTSEVAVPAEAPSGPAMALGRAGAGSAGGHGHGGGSSGGDGAGGVSEADIARMPEVDADACGRGIAYPAEAEAAGIEGDVRLRVSLTAEGRVAAVRVLAGLGHGLDQAAATALRTRCRFSPALDRSGKPVAFVIPSYTFHFQLPGR